MNTHLQKQENCRISQANRLFKEKLNYDSNFIKLVLKLNRRKLKEASKIKVLSKESLKFKVKKSLIFIIKRTRTIERIICL